MLRLCCGAPKQPVRAAPFDSESWNVHCSKVLAAIKGKSGSLKAEQKSFVDKICKASTRQGACLYLPQVKRNADILQAYKLLATFAEQVKTHKGRQELTQEEDIPYHLWKPLASLMYAAPRLKADLPELQPLKELLRVRFPDFVEHAGAQATAERFHVDELLMEYLEGRIMDVELEERMLAQIQRSHHVRWLTATHSSGSLPFASSSSHSLHSAASSQQYSPLHPPPSAFQQAIPLRSGIINFQPSAPPYQAPSNHIAW